VEMSVSSVSESVRAPKAAMLILGFLCIAPQIYFGFVGSGLLTPLGWSLGMSLFAVGTSWRAGQQGVLPSILIGTCYAIAFNVPLYLLGRWLGEPYLASAAFTALASVLGLLTFGSFALLRRIWPSQPSAGKFRDPDRASPPADRPRVSPEVRDAFSK